MKKQDIVVLGVIGLMFVGLTLVAFGNSIGAFIVGGVVMKGI